MSRRIDTPLEERVCIRGHKGNWAVTSTKGHKYCRDCQKIATAKYRANNQTIVRLPGRPKRALNPEEAQKTLELLRQEYERKVRRVEIETQIYELRVKITELYKELERI